jgi:hypothetical protein
MIEFVMLLLALVCAVAEGPKAYSNLRIAWKSVRRKRERESTAARHPERSIATETPAKAGVSFWS